MAWQFDRPDTGEGIVQAFRRKNCADQSQVFKLRGLDPQAIYTLQDLDTGTSQKRTGRQWAEEGLRITLANRPSAALLMYKIAR
jgi:alpha-galactosidase